MDNALDWLKGDPLPEEIRFNEDGSAFIPIEIVETLLTEVDPFWSDSAFRMKTFSIGGKHFASSSITLHVAINARTISRTGAATLEITEDATNVEAIMLSEAKKNAAKKYGNRFGANLNRNDSVDPATTSQVRVKKEKVATKMPADDGIIKKYLTAVANNDTENIKRLTAAYIINAPENA